MNTVTVNADNIPTSLKNRNQWLMWRLEKRKNNKVTKPPYQPTSQGIGHNYAKSNDSTTWTDFKTCLQALDSGRFNGLGFAVSKGDELAAIDLDHCFDVDKHLEPWAQEIIDQFPGTYIEYSPSGDGLHIWCLGTPQTTGEKKWDKPGTDLKQGLEVYCYRSARYFTVTGNVFANTEITECQPGLDWLYKQYWIEQHHESKQTSDANSELDINLVRKALDCIPADTYADWIAIGMALKAAGVDFQIWNEWSKKSIKYNANEMPKKWDSFNPNRTDIDSLFHYAEKYGFKSASIDSSKPSIEHKGGGHSSAESTAVRVWPVLKEAALPIIKGKPGLIREFVDKTTEFSEADRAAVLFTFLAKCGAAIGADTFFKVNSTKHPTRLNSLIIGATGRGRKGTSAAPIIELAQALPSDLKIRVTPGPLSTGEGLIFAVRDPSEELNEDLESKDPGVEDKRLLIIDEELRRALSAFKRDGNTLATTIRAAYDRGDLDPLTKNNRIKATGAHICIVSHITSEELAKHFDEIEIFSGTMNRFFLICSRRSKLVSRPKPPDEAWLSSFALRLSNRIRQVQSLGAVEFDDNAWEDWDKIYSELTQDQPGLLGAITCRAEPQVIRLSLLYALLDESIKPGTKMINSDSLRAALAALDYSKDSAKYLYGNPTTDIEYDAVCVRILEALKAAAKGLSNTEIYAKIFKSNMNKSNIHQALDRLQSSGRISQTISNGGPGIGRPKTTWYLTKGFEK